MPLTVTYCDSQPVIDGFTGQQIGWLFGMHFIEGTGTGYRCARCGIAKVSADTAISRGPEFSNSLENSQNSPTFPDRK